MNRSYRIIQCIKFLILLICRLCNKNISFAYVEEKVYCTQCCKGLIAARTIDFKWAGQIIHGENPQNTDSILKLSMDNKHYTITEVLTASLLCRVVCELFTWDICQFRSHFTREEGKRDLFTFEKLETTIETLINNRAKQHEVVDRQYYNLNPSVRAVKILESLDGKKLGILDVKVAYLGLHPYLIARTATAMYVAIRGTHSASDLYTLIYKLMDLVLVQIIFKVKFIKVSLILLNLWN